MGSLCGVGYLVLQGRDILLNSDYDTLRSRYPGEEMSEYKLKPCPFCGAEVAIGYCGTGTYEIQATREGCLICDDGVLVNHGGIVSTDIDQVVNAWNIRRTITEVEGRKNESALVR